MVGIVGILLLGSLAWSAVGALASAVGAAGSALTRAASPPAPPTLEPAVAVTPTEAPIDTPTQSNASPTVVGTVQPTATPEPVATPTTVLAGRNPWILLPAPSPGTTVPSGQITIEARGRGDAPITAFRIELDGGALPVTMEQRSESTWRGFATTRVNAGSHSVRAAVTDAAGRSGSFRWSFTAGS